VNRRGKEGEGEVRREDKRRGGKKAGVPSLLVCTTPLGRFRGLRAENPCSGSKGKPQGVWRLCLQDMKQNVT